MTKNRTTRKGTSFGIIVMLLASTVGMLAMSAPASAHTCKSEDHSGCDSHSCPDDGDVHVHRHDVHWWRDHGCSSSPSCSATDSLVLNVDRRPLDPVCSGDGIYTPGLDEITGIDPPE